MGLFSSKKSVTENKQYTTNNVSQPVFTGDNLGYNVQGEGNKVTFADPNLVAEGGAVLSDLSADNARNLETVTIGLNDGIERGLDSVDSAVLGNQQVTELALMNGAEQSAITAEALQNANDNVAMIAQDGMFATITAAQEALSFGRDSFDFGRDALDLGRDALASNERLADSFNDRLSGVVTDSLDFADQQNFYVAETLGNNAELVNQALTDMAVLQEQGLDNALTVAGNISMDDAAETSRDMVKFISIAAAVIGVGMALRG